MTIKTETDLLRALGRNIAFIRNATDMTQEQLAERCNLGVRTIQAIELGERYPRAETLIILARCLQVPIERFFKDIQ